MFSRLCDFLLLGLGLGLWLVFCWSLLLDLLPSLLGSLDLLSLLDRCLSFSLLPLDLFLYGFDLVFVLFLQCSHRVLASTGGEHRRGG